MNNRELLINYAIQANGDHYKIKSLIENNVKTKNKYENISAITILDNEYPKTLLNLKNPPFVLFYKGNIKLLNKKIVAIVGSRNPSDYAIENTRILAKNTKEVVISGLAKGIDSYAHIHALKTIAVLGCGIDYIYPYSNKELYKNIEENGLIISEYPFSVKPLKHHFPFRNRIIAALSDKMYIMQANYKSGTMTSINQMLDLGKEIYVLPFEKNQEIGECNNSLIMEGANVLNMNELSDI